MKTLSNINRETKSKMKICVFGASSDNIDKIYFEKVTELGKKMAQHSHTLIFGAGAHGLMGAAARGMESEKGKIIGIVPSFFDEGDIIYKNCTELIFTETMAERKKMMEDIADAFIMVPGGAGTYEEFFEVLTLKQLDKHRKPIAVFNVNGYYDKFEELMCHTVDTGFMTSAAKAVYRTFSDADALLAYIENDSANYTSVNKYAVNKQ